MKNRIIHNCIALVVAAMCCTVSAKAEEDYAYRSATSIDAALGVGFNVSNYKSEDYGAALFSGRVGNPILALRIDHFFSRHWGGYVKAEWLQNSYLTKQKSVLDRLHDKDDGYDYITPSSTKGRRGYAFLAGGAYRWDKQRWSLRAMLGVGYSSYNLNRSFVAYRKPEGTNHLDEMLYTVSQKKTRGIGGVVVAPTIEASLHVSRNMDFFCNLTFEYNSARVWQKFTITDTETGRVLDSTLAHEHIGNNINLNFGVRYIITHRKF